MPSKTVPWLKILCGAAMIGAPVLVHRSLAGNFASWAAACVASGQMAVLTLVLLRLAWTRVPGGIGALVACGTATIVLIACRLHPKAGLVGETALSHAALYTMLLMLFAGSLRPKHVPVATRMAMHLHGTLTPARMAYTRRVTWLWAGFFGFQLAGSGVFLAFAPTAWWSFFVNMADLPLALILFAAELVVRSWRFRGQPKASVADMMRAFSGISAVKTRLAE